MRCERRRNSDTRAREREKEKEKELGRAQSLVVRPGGHLCPARHTGRENGKNGCFRSFGAASSGRSWLGSALSHVVEIRTVCVCVCVCVCLLRACVRLCIFVGKEEGGGGGKRKITEWPFYFFFFKKPNTKVEKKENYWGGGERGRNGRKIYITKFQMLINLIAV